MRAPLVLLPGLQSDHRSWTEQLRFFEGRREVLVPYGHQFETSIDAMGRTVLPQLPDRFHLAAWSMGGYIALALLPHLRGRLCSLVLMATSARAENPASTERRLALIDQAERDGIRAAAAKSLSVSALDLAGVAADVREAVVQSWVDLGLDAYRGQQRAIIERAATHDHLAMIDVPTLVITGADDVVVAPDCAEELHARIPGSELRVLPDCGHCPPFERPGEVNALFERWLESVEADEHPEPSVRLG